MMPARFPGMEKAHSDRERAEAFLAKAKQARKMASDAGDLRARLILLEAAQGYVTLATVYRERAERLETMQIQSSSVLGQPRPGKRI